MIEKEIEKFVKNSIGNDSLNDWGLNIVDYYCDDNTVEFDSVLVSNDKILDLFDEYVNVLIDNKDNFLSVFKQELSDDVLKEINFDFLQEYMDDILVSAESNTRSNWIVFCSDEDLMDFLDINFVYNFNLSDKVIDFKVLEKYKSLILEV